MKVNHSTVNPNQTAESGYTKKANKTKGLDRTSDSSSAKKAEETAGEPGVKTELSSKAKDASQAKAIAAEAPEVREAKIAELKKRIAEGRYNVKPEAIADKMVDEHLETAGIG